MSPTRRDVVWEELERLFGKVTNANTRGRRNRATKLIRESIVQMAVDEPDHFPRNDQAVRDEIRARYTQMTMLWPGPKPTDSFLMNRWDDCNPRTDPGGGSVALNQPHRIDEPPAPPEVAAQYIEEMRSKGWLSKPEPAA
jgi:hypothetical protein